MTYKSKLLITRFTHGSGGKFLSTVLQTSSKIDHWDSTLENYKSTELFYDLCVYYTKRSFVQNPKLHLQHEPMVPYDTSLYSSTYNRGYDLTIDKFINHARDINDQRFLLAWQSNKIVNLIMNKPDLPIFCHNSCVVTILTESQQEINWLHHTLWNKHFLEQDQEILYLPNHPEYCNFKSLATILTWKNSYKFPAENKKQIIMDHVINNSICHAYTDRNNFKSSDQGTGICNVFIPLACFFDSDWFLEEIKKVFEQLDLGVMESYMIRSMHQIWLANQINPVECSDILHALN
jgi:hypothetical protein